MPVSCDILFYVLDDMEVRTVEFAILFDLRALSADIRQLIMRFAKKLDQRAVFWVVNFELNHGSSKLWKLNCLLYDTDPPFFESYFSLANVSQHIDLFFFSTHYNDSLIRIF